MPLTVNRKATIFEGMRIGSYALFYFLTIQLLNNGKYLKKTVKLVSYLAIGIAFLAIIQKFSSPDKIYWFRATPEGAGTVGPWVYHNHYAGFMEMMCPLLFALFLFYRPSINHDKPFRARIAEICTMPNSNLHVFLGVGLLVVISSVFVSLSRGGIISLSLSMFLFVLLLPKKISSFKFATYGFLIVCVALMITWFGWESIIEKFGAAFQETGGITNGRVTIWLDTLKIIPNFFLTGTGFGTFINIYPSYKTAPTDLIFDHAHNDYIELLTDGGILGFLLATWFVLSILIHGWKSMKSRRDHFAILLSIGALTSIIAILLHSATDFNMHNGANGLYFFFTCGLLISAGNTRLYYRTRPTFLDKAGQKSKTAFLVFSLALLGMTIAIRGGALIASEYYSHVANIYLNKNLRKEKITTVSTITEHAISYDPLEGKYSFALGNAQFFLHRQKEALRSFTQASTKDPLSGIYLQRLALMLGMTDTETAANLMKLSYERSLNKAPLVLTWAEWLLSTNERKKAVEVLRIIFSDKPDLFEKFIPSLTAHSFSREEMTTILPDSISAWIFYGELLDKQGKKNESEFFRKNALNFIEREEKLWPRFFTQLYWFYYDEKEYDKAVIVLRKGIETMPDHAEFHAILGDYYNWIQEIPYRAIEEYEQTLLLEPADEKTREKLENLQEKQ